MKRNYFEPKIKVSAFSVADVVTTSGVEPSGLVINENVSSESYASTASKQTVDYGVLNFQ